MGISKKMSKRKESAEKYRKAVKNKEKYTKQTKTMSEKDYSQLKHDRDEKKKELKRKKIVAMEKEVMEPSKTNKKSRGSIADVQDGGKRKREKIDIATLNGNGNRFILFVGNLPYSTTRETLSEHLAASKPDLIRLPSNKETGKLKGYAFAEFTGQDASRRMNVCLRLHHTEFENRKINVELTAGGGGSSAARVEKLKQKNEKLEKERKSLISSNASKSAKQSATTDERTNSDHEPAPFVHPSRMTRVAQKS
ncbi:uncharacterized protein V1516DRAFT_674709 [Lipomyces oligophaga]|uniref:uncharacterized protein n=1 Tax=Lipomyces oligophaga TaxID=45792 RepID=UPI0034D01A85